MPKINVTINGKEYPIKMTMGAMLRFEQETGESMNDKELSLIQNATLIWCCIKSACAHEKIPFDMTLMEFADSVDAGDIKTVVNALKESVGGKKEDASSEEGETGKN